MMKSARSMKTFMGIAYFVVLVSSIGCQRPPATLSPAINPSGWSLAVVRWSAGSVDVRLTNNTDAAVMVYEPHELFNLLAEAPAPLEGVGHTITPDIEHPPIRLVRTGDSLEASFDLGSRVRTGDRNGRFPCRVVYNDTYERAAKNKDVAKLGRVESDQFWVVVSKGKIVSVEFK